MELIYLVIMREVNKITGQIGVKVTEKGTQEFISRRITYLKMRSLQNEDLSFYLALQENEKEVMKRLKKKNIEESDLYVKI